jgi:hypothetical protein
MSEATPRGGRYPQPPALEDVARHTQAPFWFQLYVMRDRDFIATNELRRI